MKFRLLTKIKGKIKEIPKRSNYFFKFYSVISILIILGALLFLYHFNENLNKIETEPLNFVIILLAKFGLDLSFVLIPVALYLINLSNKFRKEFETLFILKERFLHLRKEVANAISEGQDIFERNAIVLNPIILNNMKTDLIKFKFTNEAELLDEFINIKMLYQIDNLLIRIIKLTKKYDKGVYYESLEKNEETNYIKKELTNYQPKSPISIDVKKYLIKKFINNVLWVITYNLFFDLEDKCPASIIYHDLSEIPKKPYQIIFDAINEILTVYIKHPKDMFVVGSISSNLKKLESNENKLIEINIKLDKIYDASNSVFVYWIHLLDEPMNILRIKITLSEGYKISIPWEKEGDNEKSEIFAYLRVFSDKFNLEIRNREFWEAPLET